MSENNESKKHEHRGSGVTDYERNIESNENETITTRHNKTVEQINCGLLKSREPKDSCTNLSSTEFEAVRESLENTKQLDCDWEVLPPEKNRVLCESVNRGETEPAASPESSNGDVPIRTNGISRDESEASSTVSETLEHEKAQKGDSTESVSEENIHIDEAVRRRYNNNKSPRSEPEDCELEEAEAEPDESMLGNVLSFLWSIFMGGPKATTKNQDSTNPGGEEKYICYHHVCQTYISIA